MTATLLSLCLGFGQGLLHAVGPDHCAAMVSLGGLAEHRRRAALVTALRFAVAHALMLGGLAAACLVLGVGLSEAFEKWAEIGGGAVLIGVAVAALLFPGALRHGHPHLGGHGHDHLHERVPMAAGALMALSGARSLLLALPPLLVGGSFSLASFGYLPGFALGVLVGMGAVGLLIAEGMSRVSSRVAGWLHRGAALASAGLGVFWIASRL